jgi:hypothetical protein
MENINNYLVKRSKHLPLSVLNFVKTSINTSEEGPKRVGEKLDEKYRLLFFDYYSFYKPITTYF